VSFLVDLGRRLRAWAYSGFGRDRWQQPDRVIAALEVRPGERVADIGAGGGYFTLRLAEAVGTDGIVYAVDTDHGLLEQLVETAEAHGLANVEPVYASDGLPSLPGPVDLAFASNAFHHLPDQPRYFAALIALLRPDGRVAIVEARGEGFFGRLLGHATPPAVIREQMEAAGYRLAAGHDFLARQSFHIFRPR
jgi:arsenite methyltransferase